VLHEFMFVLVDNHRHVDPSPWLHGLFACFSRLDKELLSILPKELIAIQGNVEFTGQTSKVFLQVSFEHLLDC
jgi:hypothetical protein